MSEIQLRESFGTFIYFFLATCVLAALGASIPALSKDIGEVMQEHIAGKTIVTLTGVSLFLAFCCAVRNVIRPRAYGTVIRLLVVNPTNFILTLCLVAAAVNWGVALSSLLLFPLISSGKVFSLLVWNAVQISAIALLLAAVAWLLHHSPAVSKTAQPFTTATRAFFWLVFAGSAVFWLAFFATIASKVLGV